MLIRDGDSGGRGRKSEGSTMDTTPKRQERPWTTARTMEVLRRCLLAIAQPLVHCAIAVSTAMLGQSHKDNVHCTAVKEQLEAKEVELSQPSSTSLLMIYSGLTSGPAPPLSSWSRLEPCAWPLRQLFLLTHALSYLHHYLSCLPINIYFWHLPWATPSTLYVLPPHQCLLLTPALSYSSVLPPHQHLLLTPALSYSSVLPPQQHLLRTPALSYPQHSLSCLPSSIYFWHLIPSSHLIRSSCYLSP